MGFSDTTSLGFRGGSLIPSITTHPAGVYRWSLRLWNPLSRNCLGRFGHQTPRLNPIVHPARKPRGWLPRLTVNLPCPSRLLVPHRSIYATCEHLGSRLWKPPSPPLGMKCEIQLCPTAGLAPLASLGKGQRHSNRELDFTQTSSFTALLKIWAPEVMFFPLYDALFLLNPTGLSSSTLWEGSLLQWQVKYTGLRERNSYSPP